MYPSPADGPEFSGLALRVAASAMEEDEEVGGSQPLGSRAVHVKKRALKNKALSVSFDEKDLKDFVTGFHKRKKKRRKVAQQKLQEAERRKRIEARKKRKLEREFALYGGAPPDSVAERDESNDNNEEEEPIAASVSGTIMYDNGDMKVTVLTSEISREEDYPTQRQIPEAFKSDKVTEKKKHQLPVGKKKQFKKVAQRKSHQKPQTKRNKRGGKR